VGVIGFEMKGEPLPLWVGVLLAVVCWLLGDVDWESICLIVTFGILIAVRSVLLLWFVETSSIASDRLSGVDSSCAEPGALIDAPVRWEFPRKLLAQLVASQLM
jgi:hypothetical protein